MRGILTSLQALGTGTSLVVVVAVVALFVSRARPAAGVLRKPPASRLAEAVSLKPLATPTPITLPDDYLHLCRAAGL